jgi:CBS domain-containing protein
VLIHELGHSLVVQREGTSVRSITLADVNQVPVMDNGRLAGIISREHLLRHIRIRSELEM